MARSDSGEPPSLLPVAYRSPWEQLRSDLGRDLPAVSASVGLRLRELWRRNREGDLSVPGFWPRGWVPLFWPLLALLLLLSLVVLLRLPFQGQGRSAPAAVISTAGSSDALLSAAETAGLPKPTPLVAKSTPADQQAAQPLAAESLAVESAAIEPDSLGEAVPQLDPLLALLQAKEGPALVASLHPLTNQGLLQLTPTAAFLALPSSQQQGQANQWQQQSQALGYDRLELRSAQGQLLGRSALLGVGMILWSTPLP